MRKSKFLLTPVLLWMSLFLIIPMLIVIGISFLSRDAQGNLVFELSMEGYKTFFDPLYLGIYWDTLVLSLLTTIICLLVSYPLAYYIAGASPRIQTWGLILITIPFWINFLIRTYAWVLLLRTQGVVNSLLMWLGWIDEPIQMLYTYGAVLLGMVYNFIPFMVLPIYVALEQMDKRLLDAASDLGASKWKAFRHITLPQSKSGIMTGSVLVYVSTSGMFVVTDILGGAKSSMISNIIQSQFLGARNWPFGAALSVIFVATSLVLILLFNRAMQARHQRVGEGR
ncbi:MULTISPECIES: ABC transporter permease [Paenibacillus]|uniref:Binding-protein-dependent transport systems inner membrane component n=3 Tax=Paenibacillus TaxID=44249 RepID=G4HPF0_9BACL|nr:MULTISPECIES: ABC transporter permease [Paenibacillus]ANY73467.1 ABC transporter permease [Paenibacillus ihbetae]EHB48595.1 binding-protein-dependent transport systems inner membrane component [Paenibacillus lactis 154]MBP1896792.1 spermidine/putrescine transport system permease protein [Paenibacillus lactis]MCM3497347.1 ABC transporter permease [Paenibacillus lactis]OOC59393.1 ABC transporter permease [Paenibacillus ihbetae]